MGPHHAEALREVAHETADEHLRPSFEAAPEEAKGRSQLYSDSDDDSSDDHDDHDDDHDATRSGASGRMSQQDALAVAQNGGVHDDSDLDIDGDDLDDDDMTGGISSSPSIEDGMCPVRDPPPCWPRRVSSLRGVTPSPNTHEASKARTPVSPTEPFAATAQGSVDATGFDPTDIAPQVVRHHHHRDAPPKNNSIEATGLDCATVEAETGMPTKHEPHDDTHGTTGTTTASQTEDHFFEKRKELEKGEHGDAVGCDGDLLIPYEPASDDDDGSDLSLPDDPCLIDSG